MKGTRYSLPALTMMLMAALVLTLGGCGGSKEASTPQDLADIINDAASKDPPDIKTVLDQIHTKDAAKQQLMGPMAELAEAMVELQTAVKKEFGDDAGGGSMMGGDMPVGMEPPKSVKVEDETDSTATIVITSAKGEVERISAIKVEQRWMIDGDKEGGFDMPNVEEGKEKETAEAISAMADVFSKMAGNVKSGKYENEEAFNEAMMGEIMSSLAKYADVLGNM